MKRIMSVQGRGLGQEAAAGRCTPRRPGQIVRVVSWCGALLLLTACGESATDDAPEARPIELASSELGVDDVTEVTGASGRVVSAHGQVLIGASDGLYGIDDQGVAQVTNPGRVDDLAIWRGSVIGVTDDGLGELVDGEWEPLSWGEGAVGIASWGDRLLVAAGDETWMTTDDDRLLAVPVAAETIAAVETSDVAVATSAGTTTLLDIPDGQDDAFEVMDTMDASMATPSTAGVVARRGGTLARRSDDGWSSLRLDGTPIEPRALASDAATGEVVIATDKEVLVVGETRAQVWEATTDLDGVVGMSVTTTSSGVREIWLARETSMLRLRLPAPTPATWTEGVGPFAEANCVRCHTADSRGTAHPLETYEQWTAEAEQILDAVGTGRMPLDGEPLVDGDADLIARWIDAGLPQ